MHICLIGNGLTNLILAKNLVKKKIKVDLYSTKKKQAKLSSRTIGVSEENIKFLRNNEIDIIKLSWQINQIKIFNELNQHKEILNFIYEKKSRFSILSNDQFYEYIKKKLSKEPFFKKKIIKNNLFYKNIFSEKKYDLVINSVSDNAIAKKIFFKKINKNYLSNAYTSIIKHKKNKNKVASQIFTSVGPLAFLPVSETETSIVFSISNRIKIQNDNNIKELILKYNKNYNIISFSSFNKFALNFSVLKNYHHNNFLAFGDCLHKIHPLAGQGFNMNLRDIKILSDLIDENLKLGLPLDNLILKEFEKKTRHLNYIFSSGIDFIYEFFMFDNKTENNYSKKIFDFLNKNEIFNRYTSEFANKGLII